MIRKLSLLLCAIALFLSCQNRRAERMIGAPDMRFFRVYNGYQAPQRCWVPVGLPFGRGELQTTGSIMFPRVTGDLRYPFKVLERWEDNVSVRRALVDAPLTTAAFQENIIYYQWSHRAPSNRAFIAPSFGAAHVNVLLDGSSYTFSNWRMLYSSWTRFEAISEVRAGALNARLYLTLWSGQPFGRATLVVGNDDLQRTEATPVSVADLSLQFMNCMAAPLFGHAHNVQMMNASTFRLLSETSIGDAQRWGTVFSILLPQANSDLVSALGFGTYPLFGMPDPDIEDHTRAYGLYGRLKGGIWPYLTMAEAPDVRLSREKWETFAAWWLVNCENSSWGRNGFWPQQEGATGAHPDWGPATCGRDDKAASPRGLHRWWCLSLTRLRTPDHYSGLRWNQAPVLPTTGAFMGWVNAPLREPGDYTEHTGGNGFQASHGWSGSDDAHREEGIRHRVYQLTGEPWIYDELQLQANMACLRAKPGGNFGEGRDMARTLMRKLTGWVIGNDADRLILSQNIYPWIDQFNASYPTHTAWTPPLHSLSVLYPSNGKYSAALVASLGLPPGSPYLLFPFTEPQVLPSLAIGWELTQYAPFINASMKAASETARIAFPDGALGDVLGVTNVPFMPRVGTWALPGLLKAAPYVPALIPARDRHLQEFQSSADWDILSWIQA